MKRESHKPVLTRDRSSFLDGLLEVMREKRAIETLLQVRARIRELDALIDLIENDPSAFHHLLHQLEFENRRQ